MPAGDLWMDETKLRVRGAGHTWGKGACSILSTQMDDTHIQTQLTKVSSRHRMLSYDSPANELASQPPASRQPAVSLLGHISPQENDRGQNAEDADSDEAQHDTRHETCAEPAVQRWGMSICKDGRCGKTSDFPSPSYPLPAVLSHTRSRGITGIDGTGSEQETPVPSPSCIPLVKACMLLPLLCGCR